jgi:hypothetical protein
MPAKRDERRTAYSGIPAYDERPLIDFFKKRRLHHFIGAARSGNATVMKKHHCRCKSGDEIQLMAHEQHRHSILRERMNELEQRHLVRKIQKRRRLIENECARFLRQRARDSHTLPFTAG